MHTVKAFNQIQYCDNYFMFNWQHEDNFTCLNMIKPTVINGH